MELYQKLYKTDRFFVIAGPCVIEEESIMRQVLETLLEETAKRNLTFIFKASYKKANRTSVESYTGPGMNEGLALLDSLKTEYNVPILTDVHETSEVKAVAEVADVIQIPAFLSRQTELLQAAARSGKIINIKKGQFMAPEDMRAAVAKITAENNFEILLTERGTVFGYHNLIVDFRSFAQMKNIDFPVIYDVTHSLQRPSVGRVSGGTPEFAPMMARAAIATGCVSGLFFETHPSPMEALSDAASMLSLSQVPELLDNCLSVINKP
ncbi:MAG: 3-deoxy-8-phosphooctulonate synthase [Candidatus Cloacimonetes bacterium]|nr:3-deoxy-8-phosphooctulonate synthase [Candidatus Cloacimonadota bacterium]